jgi:hypothetical protein
VADLGCYPKDLLNKILVFAVIIIVGVVVIVVAMDFAGKRNAQVEDIPLTEFEKQALADEKLEKQKTTDAQLKMNIPVYKDDLIEIPAGRNVAVEKKVPDKYLLAFEDSVLEMSVVKLEGGKSALDVIGSFDPKKVVTKSFNGVSYQGFVGTNGSSSVRLYMQKGSTLFCFESPFMTESVLTKILESLVYLADGAFSVDVIPENEGASMVRHVTDSGLKSETFEGFTLKDGLLDTKMFSMRMPVNWEIYNTTECLVMFDREKQTEQLAIFTLKSVTFTQNKFEQFLDRIYGKHEPFKDIDIGGRTFSLTNVMGGTTNYQILVYPINKQFGLMVQSHSAQNKLSPEQTKILESISFK